MAQVLVSLANKTALVVGADTGIGLASARALAAAGASVVMAGLDAEAGDKLAASIAHEYKTNVSFVKVDVREEAQMAALIKTAVERLGRIDIALNNAGIEGPTGPVQDMSVADFDNMMAINVRGVWLGMKYQIPVMLEQGVGSIINMASTAGLKAIPNVAIYGTTKHAIVGLTKSAAIELAKKNIRVNAIAPGPVDTGLFNRMAAGRKETIESVRLRVPMARVSEPDEIANAVVWLGSDATLFMTGAIVSIDGGVVAS